MEIDKKALAQIPARVASHYGVMPLAVEAGVLRLAAPEDFTRQSKEDLRIMLGFEPVYVAAPREEIKELISRFYGVGAGVIELLAGQASGSGQTQDYEVIDQDRDSTIITLVNELFMDALKNRASDIHIEPFEKMLKVRYRVDGLLQDAKVSEKIRHLSLNLVSRIKIMAKLDIGEKRLPQDGRIKIKYRAGELDLRVSVLPSSFGEALVIRILRPLELLELGELGFDAAGISLIRSFLKKPHGVILVTGPTGSGKTTTLYSCLKELNQTERKIITIEDPVEYKLPGVVQMQVHSKIDFTFARALRSILRHDPDCVMVGEIRDPETAQIAIRAALTGHLVFSTLHTNDAPSAVTRLVEMGVEPYLVASALEGVIAQRLLRRNAVGSAGFYGRIAAAEIMPMNDAIRDLILEGKAGTAIRRAAIENGMIPLFQDAMSKVKNNLTQEEEVLRVVGIR